jgi:hypothetical protein
MIFKNSIELVLSSCLLNTSALKTAACRGKNTDKKGGFIL